jgi:hypothetical protein
MNYRTHAYRTNLKKFTIYFIKDQKFGILCQQIEKIRSASIVLRKLYEGISTQLVSAAQMHYSCKLNIYWAIFYIFIFSI